jgi:hypothetical protein
MQRASGPDCAFRHKLPETEGDQVIVTQHRVVWRNRLPHWESVSVDEIEDVKPVKRHMLLPWIQVVTRDGSCLFVHILTVKQSSNMEAQMQILSAVTAARAAQH